jgi:hypothetical protein
MQFHNIGTPVISKQIQLNSSLFLNSALTSSGKVFMVYFLAYAPVLPTKLYPDFQFHNFLFPNWSVDAPALSNPAGLW